ncbi:hypothetical protein N0V94_000230 [Neodidymelliopsis sp. IMI 364377]|nr:hypothetical protein N0V94_000230 [Neodidymelliopsis sp. IMI 364377]
MSWLQKGYSLSATTTAPVKRQGGIDPTLTRRRNVGNAKKVPESHTQDNAVKMTKTEAERLVKSYRSRGLFDPTMIEQLRAAVKLIRSTAHQPPRKVLEKAKHWAEKVGGGSLRYAYYRRWEKEQRRLDKRVKDNKRKSTWRENIVSDEFTAGDLSWQDWCDIFGGTIKHSAGSKVRDDI